MTRLASVAIAFAVAAAVLVGPDAATASAAPNQLGCRYEKGGSWWAGEWVRLYCNGKYFTSKGRYRVYVICDRLGWQPNTIRYGLWTTKGGYSVRACDAIGDWKLLGYGIQYT